MNLQQFMEAVDSHVCGGSEFQWQCYPYGRYMDISDINNNEVGNCIFSTKSQEVYEIEFYISQDDVAYRWTDPVYAQARDDEAVSKSIDPTVAYDNIKFIEITDEEEILKLAVSIVHMTYVHIHPLKDNSELSDI